MVTNYVICPSLCKKWGGGFFGFFGQHKLVHGAMILKLFYYIHLLCRLGMVLA